MLPEAGTLLNVGEGATVGMPEELTLVETLVAVTVLVVGWLVEMAWNASCEVMLK